MNKQHEFIAQIHGKELAKVYDKKGKFYLNTYYKLKVFLEETKQLQTFFAYSNLVSKEIWQEIEQSKCYNQKLLILGEKRSRGWILKSWKQLDHHGSN